MQGLQESKRFKAGALGTLIILVIGLLQVFVPDVGTKLAQHTDQILMLTTILMGLFGIEDVVLAFKGVPVVPPDEPVTDAQSPSV